MMRWIEKTTDRLDGARLAIAFDEAEPGIVHIATEAIASLLERAGFERVEDGPVDPLRAIFSNDHEEEPNL